MGAKGQTGLTSKLILIEGLPGSGKTSTAEKISSWLTDRQNPSIWWREEDWEHPATPRNLRKTANTDGFPDRCILYWEKFASRTLHAREIRILEGSAFQSTIRFMLEYLITHPVILEYVRRFDGVVAAANPLLIYLQPVDPVNYLKTFVYPTRGEEWITKVSTYLSNTPCGRKHGWKGLQGMTEFWLLYRDLCEKAMGELTMPILKVDIDGKGWESVLDKIFSWLEPQGIFRCS